MRSKVYNALVNRHAGISCRYHKIHDGTGALGTFFSWLYLLWLNLCYYVFFCRFLGEIPQEKIYEEKRLLKNMTEAKEYSAKEYIDKLASYDVISFDIFDTLILRGFSQPQDLFYYVGSKLPILDFARIRMEMEGRARQEFHEREGSYEIGLCDIWHMLEREVGLDAENGMMLEKEAELKFCFANPFMKQVYDEMLKAGKKIVITSDMYLDSIFLRELLEKCGYKGFEKIFVSFEYKKNKYEGTLYDVVKEWIYESDDKKNVKIAHVGDNLKSDVEMAKKSGIDSFYYPNVNRDCSVYRSMDMSPIVGGAYRGVVDNMLYCGCFKTTPEYEYGYVYGGLFVYGYCHFINEYCKSNGIDRVLFLSRDGDILKKAYDLLFPDEDTVYAYWSRKAATKLMSDDNKYDYFRRFLFHKVNQSIPLKAVFESMGLLELYEPFISSFKEKINGDECLTGSNVNSLKNFLQSNWEKVQKIYSLEHKGAKLYYDSLLCGCKRAAAVDIGWAGSGAVSLNYLCKNVWHICDIVGIIAGTNTVYNAEPFASEAFLQNGILVSYMYSQSHNRDLLKKHNPNKDYNVFWELLLSSATPQFDGFGYDDAAQTYELKFGKKDYNPAGIEMIQKGILDFIKDYKALFGGLRIYENISGRDAYAPMLAASGHNERYLKRIEKLFDLKINV